jgi:hypothetical protein
LIILASGFLGSIPELHGYMGLMLWFVIPIGGFFTGMFFGWIEALIANFMKLKVTGFVLLCFVVSAGVAYFAKDVGLYLSLSLPVQGVEGIPDGTYPVKDLVSFQEFMTWNLSSLKVEDDDFKFLSYEFGGGFAKVTYGLHLLGALIGAFFGIVAYKRKHPFCDACNCYLENSSKHEICFCGPEHLEYILEGFMAVQNGSQSDAIKLIHRLESQFSNNSNIPKDKMRVKVIHQCCPKCGIGVLFLMFSSMKYILSNEAGWSDNEELNKEIWFSSK